MATLLGVASLLFPIPGATSNRTRRERVASSRLKETVGKALFFDRSLSEPAGQSCASCHDPAHHFANSTSSPIAEGAIKGRFGNRKPPSLLYASFSPKFHFDRSKRDYVGGYFWDGRASNLKEQAKGPLLNPAEMNNTSRRQVVQKVASGPTANAFRETYGSDIFDHPDKAFDDIADAISAYEMTQEFHPFSSKYDAYLQGRVKLSKAELHGLRVFNSEKLGNCAACHPSKPGPLGEPPLFTDFSYDNIGLPINRKNPFLRQPRTINPDGPNFVDEGLSKTTARKCDRGRFKVPTLRNIVVTSPYFHNASIRTLREAILFYSVRDSGRFGKPEIPDTMNHKELGNLYLTQKQVEDLEAFLKTLTDGYKL